MRIGRISRHRGQAGFTLIELLITTVLLSVGFGIIVTMYMTGWQLWRKSFLELTMQQQSRTTMALLTQHLREASPGTVVIDNMAGAPNYSRIIFSDGRGQDWMFRQNGDRIEKAVTVPGVGTTTDFIMSDVSSLSFVYPSFQDMALIDVGLTASKVPYAKSAPIVVQVVERVIIRNP